MGGALPRPMGSKKVKALKKAEEESTDISVAQSKAMDKMSRSTDNIAITLERRRQSDSLIKRATLYVKMGRQDEAMKLMEDAQKLEDSFAANTARRVAGRAIDPSPLTVPPEVSTGTTAMDHLQALEKDQEKDQEDEEDEEGESKSSGSHPSQPSDDSRLDKVNKVGV